jgi:hypothetical protein
MPKQYAKLRILSDTAGTVSDAVGTLKIIDDAYLHLYAANTYFDEILNTHHGHRRFFRIELIEAGLIPWGFHTRKAVTSQEIRTHLLLAEDQLVLSAVRFESPGFWEVLGSSESIGTATQIHQRLPREEKGQRISERSR